ncbi:MAG: XVIPCD domain-containing protein [Lysobacteraceae bacterium]
MHSETPQEPRPVPAAEATDAHERREVPGSLGREISEHIDLAHRYDREGLTVETTDPGPMLMPHERQLSPSEQRSLLASRRHTDDGVDDTVIQERIQQAAERALRMAERRLEAGTVHDHRHGSASHGGRLMNDSAHPSFPMYEAVLKGLHAQDSARLPLSADERSNVAGALTAHLAQTPGFNREGFDAKHLSVALNETNDRVFAIHGQQPGAPDAVYANVSVDHAKQQSLQVSTAAAMVEPPQPQRHQDAPQQDAPAPAVAPRSLG